MAMTKEGSNLRDLARRWSENKSIKPGVYNCLMTIADRIDAEMAELPKDRDGVPIRIGEVLYEADGTESKVMHIDFHSPDDPPDVKVKCKRCDVWLAPTKYRTMTHERPDSWERIAQELEAWCDRVDVDRDACGEPRELARRIRRLAKERGHERE